MITHLDASGRPQMVDVGGKSVTARMALARAEVLLPKELAALIGATAGNAAELVGKKGPIFQTAILAGTMAVKRTPELIPLCHPLPLDDCKIELTPQPPAADGSCVVRIDCRVRATAKTGVEMEALTGATVAALTVYDMGKAVSHAIEIRSVRLLEKTGGKSDVRAPA